MKSVTGRIAAAALFFLAPAWVALAEPIRIVALGDSLTAGYGLTERSDAFPAKLEEALKARGHDVVVVDAGVSGDTSTGGLARVDWSVGDEADGVIVELGANDMLRGIDPARTAEAIDALVGRLAERDKAVLLAGMLAAPNFGPEYAEAFNAIYPAVAEKHGTLFYPFFLEGVAADPSLNQPDGIHPNAAGVEVIVGNILPAVERLIDRIKESD